LRRQERFGPPSDNHLIHGDSLDVARRLLDTGWRGRVDLVYVDPPFGSQASYTHEARLDGPADGRVRRTRAYDDSWPDRRGPGASDAEDGIGAYLDMLAPRLEALAALLAPTGTIWVHLDWRAAYLVRVLLDEVLGRRRFINEVVWRRAPNLGRQAASGQFGRTLDTLVVYGGPAARLSPPTRLEPIAASAIRRDEEGRPFTAAPRGDYTDESMARLDAEGRVHRTASGRQYVKYFLEPNQAGELCRERRIDTLWTDVPPLRHAAVSERTGFPTQKPRALLERIVRCATPPGGLVVDLFAGSGTAGEAAHALGRTFFLGDRSSVAINVTRARLLRAKVPFAVESCGDVAPPTDADPEVRVTRPSLDQIHLDLLRPTEPLAWAVGQRAADGRPFVASWHSERRPGAVPVAAVRQAVVPAAPRENGPSGGEDADGGVEVRVYGDDGSIAVHPVSTADSPP
jgi:DNA modification methylase